MQAHRTLHNRCGLWSAALAALGHGTSNNNTPPPAQTGQRRGLDSQHTPWLHSSPRQIVWALLQLSSTLLFVNRQWKVAQSSMQWTWCLDLWGRAVRSGWHCGRGRGGAQKDNKVARATCRGSHKVEHGSAAFDWFPGSPHLSLPGIQICPTATITRTQVSMACTSTSSSYEHLIINICSGCSWPSSTGQWGWWQHWGVDRWPSSLRFWSQ